MPWKNSTDKIVSYDPTTFNALCEECGFRYGNHYSARAGCPTGSDRREAAVVALNKFLASKPKGPVVMPKGCLRPRVYRSQEK